jgi:hypothetical protein
VSFINDIELHISMILFWNILFVLENKFLTILLFFSKSSMPVNWWTLQKFHVKHFPLSYYYYTESIFVMPSNLGVTLHSL